MQTRRPAHPGPAFLVAAAVVVVDQLTKLAAARHASGLVLPARNPAYAFGVVGGSAPVLVGAGLVVLAVFLVLADALVTRFAIPAVLPALIAGGTVGNILDRIQFGAVRDFLVTPWAIINLADVAVGAGVVGLTFALAVRAPRLQLEASR